MLRGWRRDPGRRRGNRCDYTTPLKIRIIEVSESHGHIPGRRPSGCHGGWRRVPDGLLIGRCTTWDCSAA